MESGMAALVPMFIIMTSCQGAHLPAIEYAL